MKTADLLQSLVQYVLVGGLAVQLHGYLRSAFGIDLVLAMNDENLVRFIAVAKRYGLVPTIPVSMESLRNAGQIGAELLTCGAHFKDLPGVVLVKKDG